MTFAQINNCVFMDKDKDWFVIVLWNRNKKCLDVVDYDMVTNRFNYCGAVNLDVWIEKEDKNLGKMPICGLESFPKVNG